MNNNGWVIQWVSAGWKAPGKWFALHASHGAHGPFSTKPQAAAAIAAM